MTATILHGDCIEVMRSMPDDSIDSIVTDPPYGLGFMGKKWDDLPPGLDFAVEALRVLKPGGHLLAFGGTRTWHRLAVAIEDAGFEIRDSLAWMHGQGFPKGKAQMKPAFEPVVMARKKTIAPRTGLLNIDAARIVYESAEDERRAKEWPRPNVPGRMTGFLTESGKGKTGAESHSPAGRWPANVILDEGQAAALDKQTGHLHGSGNKSDTGSGADVDYGASSYSMAYQGRANRDYGSAGGGASRFFYIAKASKKERPVVDGVIHPTVKPLALMQWLVRLVTPAGGTVLDPFAGSGTTIEAALSEGFNVIGIEREAEYLPLIEYRIDRYEAGGI